MVGHGKAWPGKAVGVWLGCVWLGGLRQGLADKVCCVMDGAEGLDVAVKACYGTAGSCEVR